MQAIRRIALAAVLALVGCYGQHDAQAADTNTNWLSPCERTADCSGGLMCIDALCTLPCMTATTCAELSDEAACVRGSCREGSEDQQLAEPGFDAGSPIATFDDAGYIVLSDSERPASPPKVIWSEGRWLVAWESVGPGAEPPAIELAEVTSAGLHATRRAETQPMSSPRVIAAINDAEQVLSTHEPGADSDACGAQIHDFRTGTIQDVDLPCTERPSAASIRGTDEWIIASSRERAIEVGRYSTAAGWIAPLEVIGERDEAPGNTLEVTSAGNAATFVWNDALGSAAFLVDDLATLTSGTLQRFGAPVVVEGPYSAAQLDDRVITAAPFAGYVWTSVLGVEPELPLGNVASTGVVDRKPGTAFIAERDRLAICYATGPGPEGGAAGRMDGVEVVLIDRNGNVAEADATRSVASEMVNSGGCDLAWSGSELLVAWWDIDVAEAGTSIIRAQRLDVPW